MKYVSGAYVVYYYVRRRAKLKLWVGVGMWEIEFLKVLRKLESTISGVLLYAKNDSAKISDRLGTLKGPF